MNSIDDKAVKAVGQPMSRSSFFKAVGLAGAAGVALAATQERPAMADESTLPWLNVKDYGAVGDGKTDDAPAIQSALDVLAGRNHSGVLYFPTGDYLVGAKITGSANTWRMVIRGDGMGASRLFSNNTDGIFKIDSLARQTTITIEHLSLFSNLAGGGTAIEVTMPEGGNLHNRTLVVSHVEMRGTTANLHYFNSGIQALGQWRPLFIDVVFSGVFGPGTNANDPKDAHYTPDYAFRVDGSYAPAFSYCYAWSANIGYSIRSSMNPAPEDASFYRSFAVECRIGMDIDTPATDGEPQLEIDTLHVNCLEVGIRLRHRKYFQITNCLLYGYVYLNQTPHPYTDIQLIGSFGGLIEHTIFHQPTNPDRTMIDIDGDCFDMGIRNNTFNAAHTAISVADGARNIRVSHNYFNTGVDPVAHLPLVGTILADATDEVIFAAEEHRGATVALKNAFKVETTDWTAVAWQTAASDTNDFWSDQNNTQLVIPTNSGIRYIRVSCAVSWSDSGAVGAWQEIAIQVNNEFAAGCPRQLLPGSTGGDRTQALTSAVLPVTGGDTVRMVVRRSDNAGTQLATNGTWMSIEAVNG